VSYLLLVEAEGYRLAAGQPFQVTDGDHEENFKLEPAPVIKGRIIDPQGRLLKGATVHLATALTPLQYNRDDDYMARAPYVTGESGYFQFAAPAGPFKLVVVHPDGYRRLDFDQDQQPGQIRLEPWAHVEGTLWQAGHPVPNATVLVQLPSEKASDRFILRESRQVRTDTNGRFVFSMIPPSRVVIRPYLSVWLESPLTSSHHLAMDLKPGEKVDLNLGGNGAQVIGSVVLKGDVPEKFDLNYSLNYLIRRHSALSPPEELKDVAAMVEQGWSPSILRSAEGDRYRDLHDQHFVRLSPDGQFFINGVPPGEYEFAISIYERPQGCLVDPIAVKIVPVTISQADVDAGNVSLPAIEVQFPERLHVGGTLPNLTLSIPSGDPIQLSQFNGRPLLIHGWATWCAPCIESLTKIKQLRADFSSEKLATVGINLDEDVTVGNEYASREGLEWDHVFVGLRSEVARRLGFSSIPSYIVVSAEGKIVLQTNEWKDAEREVKRQLER
jgi:thiol-disulfide isomerase/thioredoxin/protocatechuate 3,4-dioxygenase beta subunit